MSKTNSITTKSGKIVTVKVTGSARLGYCGSLVARNGRVVADTDVVPFRERAIEAARELAAKV